ncbi:MAG TPA: glycosyltransferase family 4 protein [Chloroflexota bacterium]|nr:glycosyltransferase family 4 protein [Chloroflexota bacterium]
MPAQRVLMIAHDFPPAGGSGSNRALAFARYLPECGWEPTVVTPGEAWAANRDDRLLDELPTGVRVIRTRSFEPRPSRAPVPSGVSPARPPGPLRANLGHLKRFPDAHLGWLPFALAAARRVDYDVAYTSSGPFTSHVVGLLLKRLSRRPWVVELRDGWYRWNRAIFPDYPRWRDTLERRLEAAALKNADRVVLVTDRMANAFRGQYDRSLPAEHFAVVPNGFDRAQFPELAPGPPGDGFGVLHAGALYYGRSLSAVLEAARRLVSTVPAFARKFSLTLLGTLDPGARAELERSGLADRIRYRGQLEHASTIQAMRAADVLLLVANTTPGAEATVPGKLFEYMAVGRPVLAIAPPDSSTADVLNQTGIGWLAPSGDPAAIASALLRVFEAHEAAIAPDRGARTHKAPAVVRPVIQASEANAFLQPSQVQEAADVREALGGAHGSLVEPSRPDGDEAFGARAPHQVARFDRRLLTRDLASIFDQASQGAARSD